MPFKTFVAGEVLTAADVNTFLAKQAVIVCTSGTRPAAPVEGMTIYQTDDDKLLTYDGTVWNLPKNVVGGTLGYAEITASPATFTTEVAVAGLSVNVTVAANRRIKITFMARVSNNTAGAGVWAHIKEGADYRGSGSMVPGGTNQPSILTFSRVLVAPAAGAHTYSISVQTANGGTGTLTAGTDTAFTIPAFILVEDIGAA